SRYGFCDILVNLVQLQILSDNSSDEFGVSNPSNTLLHIDTMVSICRRQTNPFLCCAGAEWEVFLQPFQPPTMPHQLLRLRQHLPALTSQNISLISLLLR